MASAFLLLPFSLLLQLLQRALHTRSMLPPPPHGVAGEWPHHHGAPTSQLAISQISRQNNLKPRVAHALHRKFQLCKGAFGMLMSFMNFGRDVM